MAFDSFWDPNGIGSSTHFGGILKSAGFVRKAEAPVPEPEDLVPESATEEATEEKEKVILRNPKWEVENVGFNEETEVSVEAALPEKEAHKTKVMFELFAKVPGKPERISQAEGRIADGKAVAKIPVYIPQYKDEEGNSLAKVEYYFTAKHSASDLLEDDTVVKLVDEMAERLIKSHILPGVTFATDGSFISPANVPSLKNMVTRIKEWKKSHPDGKMAIFGHTDAVGKEDYNKRLSERRANSLYAFLIKDPAIWNSLYGEEKWGLASTQEILNQLGHNPGPIDGLNGNRTMEAVKAFQGEMGLPASGEENAATREALYKAFMDESNQEKIVPKDFDVIDGKAFAGCSEFNLSGPTQGACDANRRVALFLLKSNKSFPIQYPCKQGSIAPCKGQKDRKGERRTSGFGCFFYDKLILESEGETAGTAGKLRLRILDFDGAPLSGSFVSVGDSKRVELDGEGWCEMEATDFEGKALCVETGELAYNWNPNEDKETGVA